MLLRRRLRGRAGFQLKGIFRGGVVGENADFPGGIYFFRRSFVIFCACKKHVVLYEIFVKSPTFTR